MLFPIYCETEYEKYYTIDMLKGYSNPRMYKPEQKQKKIGCDGYQNLLVTPDLNNST
jgi:hypothetical protein